MFEPARTMSPVPFMPLLRSLARPGRDNDYQRRGSSAQIATKPRGAPLTRYATAARSLAPAFRIGSASKLCACTIFRVCGAATAAKSSLGAPCLYAPATSSANSVERRVFVSRPGRCRQSHSCAPAKLPAAW